MRVKGTKMDKPESLAPVFIPLVPIPPPPLPYLQFSFPLDSIYFGDFNNLMLRWIIQRPQPPHTHTHTHFHLSKFLVSSIAQTYAAGRHFLTSLDTRLRVQNRETNIFLFRESPTKPALLKIHNVHKKHDISK